MGDRSKGGGAVTVDREALRELRTDLTTLEPGADGREELGWRLLRATHSDFASQFSVQETAENLVYRDRYHIGDPGLTRVWNRWGVGMGFSPGHGWDPRDPPPLASRAFQRLPRALRNRPPGEATDSFYEQTYLRPGISDHARLLAYDGATFLGWVGALRLKDRPDFTPADLALLEGLQAPLRAYLNAVHAQIEEPLKGDAAIVITNAMGRVEYASAAARAWLDAARRRELAERVRAIDRAVPGHVQTVWEASADIVRLASEGGAVRYVATLRSTHRVRRRRLTRRQREIAEFAAAGATAREIAAELSISAHTVRQHLKEVYRALGVGSRVELARTLDER